ncbi:MAG: sigma-70 family RNA polymerase sigma factor [Armatimonadetes bacterium]|nr:sigma-70 family RNA polymerase sigma factor [Armatimonadota bacterium]
MDELKTLVDQAKIGDMDAFSAIVGRFQDMALAYAYSVLGDFHLAEDAAQEAFLQAYRDLDALREPAAFPGWFRRIVFKRCDRITRGKRLSTVPLDSVVEIPAASPGPEAIVESREIRQNVLDAIRNLPQNERTVTTLFYINGYTQKDIAAFLEMPVTTVNNRLHSSRTRLKERMVQMVNDELKTHSLSDDFPERIRLLLEMPRPMEIADHPVRQLWQTFKSYFADAEVVEFDEVCERDIFLADGGDLPPFTYIINDRQVMRYEFTSLMVDKWLRDGGGPCKRITTGRVFREEESETRLIAHHQAEMLWVKEAGTGPNLDEAVRDVANRLLPGFELRRGDSIRFPFLGDIWHYEALWRGSWFRVAGAGVVKDEWVTKAGLNPKKYTAMGFAFGLERCAMVALDIDDIRTFWKPPYVPDNR